MGDNQDRDLAERVSTLEVQVKDIGEVKQKLDSLYNLIMEMKLDALNTKQDYATKSECSTCRKEFEQRLASINEGRQKLFWTVLSSGLLFTFWLVEQLLHISIHVGG